MAVFLLKTLEGLGYTPPACVTGIFDDVPCDRPFAPWIYELAPAASPAAAAAATTARRRSTRGQMAVFITKTFNLQ